MVTLLHLEGLIDQSKIDQTKCQKMSNVSDTKYIYILVVLFVHDYLALWLVTLPRLESFVDQNKFAWSRSRNGQKLSNV